MSPDAVDPWTRSITRVLAPNPGPMTLEGTNTLVVRAPGSAGAVVVDPGPDDPAHLRRILALGPVELILLTHRHADHSESAPLLAELTGAPVRAVDPALCLDAPPLADGEVIRAAGCRIRVLATPGHTDDSVCLVLDDDGPLVGDGRGSVLTGDTVLGRGTTVLTGGAEALADYERSLRALVALGPVTAAPGHGPIVADLAAAAAALLEHRRQWLAQVREASAELGVDGRVDDAAVSIVTDRVYGDVDAGVRFAAELSVRVQLEHLAANLRD